MFERSLHSSRPPLMLSVSQTNELFTHMEWADARVWTAIVDSPAASADQQVRNVMFHTHLTQHVFLRLWCRAPRERYSPESFPTSVALLAWARTYYDDLHPFLAQLPTMQLDQETSVPWAKLFASNLPNQPGVTTLGETFYQVAAHSGYHRGQVNARLRTLGVEPPLVDYIAWIWLGRPAASWPDADPQP